MKHQDYESAAMYYDQFIAEYAKSPYLQKVQHAAIDARLKGYLGPDYDSSGLEKARELVKKTMKTFPEQAGERTRGSITRSTSSTTPRPRRRSRRRAITSASSKVASAEYYFGKIPQRWPNSPWAVKAKVELAQLAKMPRTPSKPSKIMIPPGSTDPFGRRRRDGHGRHGHGRHGHGAWAWAAWAGWVA